MEFQSENFQENEYNIRDLLLNSIIFQIKSKTYLEITEDTFFDFISTMIDYFAKYPETNETKYSNIFIQAITEQVVNILQCIRFPIKIRELITSFFVIYDLMYFLNKYRLLNYKIYHVLLKQLSNPDYDHTDNIESNKKENQAINLNHTTFMFSIIRDLVLNEKLIFVKTNKTFDNFKSNICNYHSEFLKKNADRYPVITKLDEFQQEKYLVLKSMKDFMNTFFVSSMINDLIEIGNKLKIHKYKSNRLVSEDLYNLSQHIESVSLNHNVIFKSSYLFDLTIIRYLDKDFAEQIISNNPYYDDVKFSDCRLVFHRHKNLFIDLYQRSGLYPIYKEEIEEETKNRETLKIIKEQRYFIGKSKNNSFLKIFLNEKNSLKEKLWRLYDFFEYSVDEGLILVSKERNLFDLIIENLKLVSINANIRERGKFFFFNIPTDEIIKIKTIFGLNMFLQDQILKITK